MAFLVTGALLAAHTVVSTFLRPWSPRPEETPSSRTGKPADAVQKPAALSSAALESRLLDPRDLGSGYLPGVEEHRNEIRR
jgi:hypothetical protein